MSTLIPFLMSCPPSKVVREWTYVITLVSWAFPRMLYARIPSGHGDHLVLQMLLDFHPSVSHSVSHYSSQDSFGEALDL